MKDEDKFKNITFIPPKRQSRLNGELGLTVEDIAKSLGIDSHRLTEKLFRRGKWAQILAARNHKVIVGISDGSTAL